MADLLEIVITSDASGSQFTCSAWDPRAGTNLMTYKGGGAAGAKTISFIENKFIASANGSKPLIHIWPVNSQEQVQDCRFVAPGRVTSMAISPNGCYCIAAVAENIYIWQICSGNLLAVLSRHFQPVTAIRFIDDGSHFVSAGKDGMVFVWNLGAAISANNNQEQPSPRYSYSDHALSVSDVYIGKGSIRAYLITVSLDRTCKIYDTATGNLLLNLVFDEPLTAVTMDHLDTKIYLGSAKGNIYEFSLQSPPRMKEYHLTADNTKNKLAAHKGPITALSISIDGETMLSGGDDENVMIWHLPSKQLMRTLAHKGPITNAFFRLAPKAMFDPGHKLTLICKNLKRMIDTSDDGNENIMEILVSEETIDDDQGVQMNTETFVASETTASGSTEFEASATVNQELDSLRNEIKQLKRINKELFQFKIKQALN